MKKLRVVLATALMASALSIWARLRPAPSAPAKPVRLIVTVCAKMDKYDDNFLGCETW